VCAILVNSYDLVTPPLFISVTLATPGLPIGDPRPPGGVPWARLQALVLKNRGGSPILVNSFDVVTPFPFL